MPPGNRKPSDLLRLSKSCISSAEIEAVVGVLKQEFLGMGAATKKFEEDLEHFIGRPAICVSSGTAALQLALQA